MTLMTVLKNHLMLTRTLGLLDISKDVEMGAMYVYRNGRLWIVDLIEPGHLVKVLKVFTRTSRNGWVITVCLMNEDKLHCGI